jgi:F-type H+-transporting ATPase subunit epsilon
MHFSLISPAGVQFQEAIDHFVVQSRSTGDFAVLEDHVPVIAALEYATIKLVTKSSTLFVVVINGNLEFSGNEASVIAQEANVGKTEAQALAALEEFREIRIEENRARQVDFTKAENELKKNIKQAGAGRR